MGGLCYEMPEVLVDMVARRYGVSVKMLREWFYEGEERGDDWMLIVSDRHAGREFPVYENLVNERWLSWYEILRGDGQHITSIYLHLFL